MRFHIITEMLLAEIHSFIHFVFDSYNSISASGLWPQVNVFRTRMYFRWWWRKACDCSSVAGQVCVVAVCELVSMAKVRLRSKEGWKKRLSLNKHHQGLRDKRRHAARARALLGAHLIHFKMWDLPDSRLGARSGRYNDLEDGQTDFGLAEELSVLHDEECQLKITADVLRPLLGRHLLICRVLGAPVSDPRMTLLWISAPGCVPSDTHSSVIINMPLPLYSPGNAWSHTRLEKWVSGEDWLQLCWIKKQWLPFQIIHLTDFSRVSSMFGTWSWVQRNMQTMI